MTPAGSEDEEVERRHAEILARVRRQRQLLEIQAMEQELAGEQPDLDVAIEGLGLPARGRKRRVSDDETETSFLRSLKLSDTPTFSGKSMKDLQRFDIGWKNIFRMNRDVSPEAWETRINLAGQRLRDTAAQAWNRTSERYTSWSSFVAFLRTVVADPAVRMAESLQTLAMKQQRESQSVRELVAEIEELEDNIPEMTKEVREAWTLLLAMKPELRMRVLSEHKEITSRDQVLLTAQRHENAMKHEASSRARTVHSTAGAGAPFKSYSHKSHESRTSDKYTKKYVEKAEKTTEKKQRSEGPICYNCKKPGHKLFQCDKPKRNRSVEKHHERDKSKK